VCAFRSRRQALFYGTGDLTGTGLGTGTGVKVGAESVVGTETGTGTVTSSGTLSGEVVKITCDGSYDSYYCCATESADSLEESSLAAQLRKIPWYDLTTHMLQPLDLASDSSTILLLSLFPSSCLHSSSPPSISHLNSPLLFPSLLLPSPHLISPLLNPHSSSLFSSSHLPSPPLLSPSLSSPGALSP
jgi:hypothetical protein